MRRREMAQSSAIEWTKTTWNPVVGCRKVSAGCAHCYAERMARRLVVGLSLQRALLTDRRSVGALVPQRNHRALLRRRRQPLSHQHDKPGLFEVLIRCKRIANPQVVHDEKRSA